MKVQALFLYFSNLVAYYFSTFIKIVIMINKNHKKTILITGASSGLGKALAIQYARLDHRLIISGRSKERLEAVKQECLKYTSEVYSKVVDVCEKENMHKWIYSVAKQYPLDLVIANAGISAGTLGGIEGTEQAYKIFDTNLYGVLNTVLPAKEIMAKQKFGQIAIISSIAGLLPMPGAPSYSTTKAAIRILGDALRVELKKHAIKVNIIIPGFIKTPLTDVNDFPMPFLLSSSQAAKIIINGLDNNKAYIYFPKTLYYLAKFASILPRPLLDYILSIIPAKGMLKEGI
jgi:short-subunit dehydrogenase